MPSVSQVLSRRRKMLLDMSEGIELEMRDALGEDLVKLGIRVLNKALAYGPLSKDPEWFNDDENFAHCMQQTLYLQHGITSEIKRLNSDKVSITPYSTPPPCPSSNRITYDRAPYLLCTHITPLTSPPSSPPPSPSSTSRDGRQAARRASCSSPAGASTARH